MTLTIISIVVGVSGIIATCVAIGQGMKKSETVKNQVIVQGDVIMVMDKETIENYKVKKAIR